MVVNRMRNSTIIVELPLLKILGVTPDFKWRGWLNGAKNENQRKSLALPTTTPPPHPLKTTTTKHGPKFNPPKFPYWISEPYQLVLWNRCNVMHGILKQAQNNAAGIHTGTNTNLEMVWKTQKFPHNQEATQKNTCQIFHPPKIPGIKISNPKNALIIPVTWNPEYPPTPRPPWAEDLQACTLSIVSLN